MIPGITAGSPVEMVFVPPVVDPNAVSLLHFDEVDGSTTFTDEAGIIWTPAGDAQIDTSQARFGTGSLMIDASGDWLDATNAVFAVGPSANFTAECFVRLNVVSGNHFLFGFGSGWGVYALSFNNGFALFNGIATNVIVGGTGQATINTWHHVALVRASGSFVLYIGGNSIGSVANTTNFNVGNMRLGAQTTGTGNLNGRIDEWRFSNIARYTGFFTPPVAPFDNP